jgi:hypothetical protein
MVVLRSLLVIVVAQQDEQLVVEAPIALLRRREGTL